VKDAKTTVNQDFAGRVSTELNTTVAKKRKGGKE
jgi:hypothetical protein